MKKMVTAIFFMLFAGNCLSKPFEVIVDREHFYIEITEGTTWEAVIQSLNDQMFAKGMEPIYYPLLTFGLQRKVEFVDQVTGEEFAFLEMASVIKYREDLEARESVLPKSASSSTLPTPVLPTPISDVSTPSLETPEIIGDDKVFLPIKEESF